jgi:hypothetical protein
MKTLPRATVLLLAAAAACKIMPFYNGPDYDHRKNSLEAVLNRKADGVLPNKDSDNVQGFRYEVGAPGALIAFAKPVNPAAQISVSIFSIGDQPIAKGDPGKKADAQDLQPGTYWVVVSEPYKSAVDTRFTLTTLFKPQDPEMANGPQKSQSGARDMPSTGTVEGAVDYSAMKRTQYWKMNITAGSLNLKFAPSEGNLVAELIPPSGAPEKIDPVAGLKKDKLPGGDYFVKVYAADAGDAGKYQLTSAFAQGDVCENGGPACDPAGAEELKLPQDSKAADVDFNKAKARHFYKATLKDKGRLTIVFKVTQPSRGSRIGAWFKRTSDDDDEGERITGTSVTKEIEAPGEYFIKIAAAEPGDYGKYAIQTIWQPSNFISGEMVELGRNPCMLTVQAGSNQGVRAGAACTIVVGNNPSPIDACVVDQAFPNLSKVRPLSAGCRIPTQNVRVQISQ